MPSSVVGIQPDVLRWARESLGYSLDEVAARLKKKPSDIADWEAGRAAPTYAKLEQLAYEIYKRPLAVFFLPAPPVEAVPKREFRTLPESDLDELHPDTRYKIRLAHALQLSLKDLNEGVNPVPRKIFREVALTRSSAVPIAATAVREHLKVSLDIQVSWKSADDALKAWRDAVEAAGVFVFKGSFKQRSISGFGLVDAEFPSFT